MKTMVASSSIILCLPLHNTNVYFVIKKKHKGKVRYVFSKVPDKKEDYAIAAITCSYPDVEKFARRLKFEKDGNVFVTDSRDAFLRLMLFTAVRRVIRDEKRAEKLADIVYDLPYFELVFWIDKMRNTSWWEMDRIARAFLMVYNV